MYELNIFALSLSPKINFCLSTLSLPVGTKQTFVDKSSSVMISVAVNGSNSITNRETDSRGSFFPDSGYW